MTAWRDPYPMDQPLDVRVVAQAIAQEFIRLLGYAKDRLAFDFREAALSRGIEPPRLCSGTLPREVQEIHDKVIEVLRAYDEGRTRHIDFLKNELIHLHRITVRPVLIPNKPEEPKS